jgi:hypothetical protein
VGLAIPQRLLAPRIPPLPTPLVEAVKARAAENRDPDHGCSQRSLRGSTSASYLIAVLLRLHRGGPD